MPLIGSRLAEAVQLRGILRLGLEQKPEETALASEVRNWTWQQLEQTSNRLASAYLGLGLRPGDRVASLMPNRPACIVHYLACLKAGLVATPLNYRYTPPEVDHALEVSGAALLVHHAERQDDVRNCRRCHSLSKGVVAYGTPETCSYEALLAQGDPDFHWLEAEGRSPAFIFFTSGSSGLPKGVTHTREGLGWMLASVRSAFQLMPDDVVLPGSSLSHMAATIFGMACLASGARLAIPRGSHPDELLPLIRSSRPTVMFMLPAALSNLVGDPRITREDLSSLRACFAGGDKLSAELETQFIQLAGQPMEEGYGMTEIGHAATLPRGASFRAGSIGKPCPGYEFSLRDEQGREVSCGEAGRAWVRFAGMTIGYWSQPSATAETIVEGWLDTGDVMSADEDGYLWFQGRRKQIIVHDGSNICPEEVELAVSAHPAVESVGVVGIHDLVHGENVLAYVKPKPGVPRPAAAELIRFARQRVGYKAPETVIFLSEMPMNATGKIDRLFLKKMTEQRIQVVRAK